MARQGSCRPSMSFVIRHVVVPPLPRGPPEFAQVHNTVAEPRVHVGALPQYPPPCYGLGRSSATPIQTPDDATQSQTLPTRGRESRACRREQFVGVCAPRPPCGVRRVAFVVRGSRAWVEGARPPWPARRASRARPERNSCRAPHAERHTMCGCMSITIRSSANPHQKAISTITIITRGAVGRGVLLTSGLV